MLVDLTDIFTKDGSVQELEVLYEADAFTSWLGTFPIKEKGSAALRLSNIGQSKALAEGRTKLTFVLACDRCLSDVDYTFDLSFQSELISPDYSGADSDDDALEVMEGYCLNVDKLINNEILLNWPMKVLCREDCKGICKVCGKNLNDGECGCDDFVPDPRMAVIKDIFNANKEV